MVEHIAITGATGFLGTRITSPLLKRGYVLHILARNPEKAKMLYPDARHYLWAPGMNGEWRNAIASADAVIHLAGESIGGQRWNDVYKKRLRESRVIGTREIVSAMVSDRSKPKVLLSASGIGYYGDCGETDVTESSPPGRDFLAQLCVDWEKEANHASANGVRVVIPRQGLVLAKEGGALPRLMMPFRFFAGGPIGSGRQWFPWIHIDDVVRFYMRALEDEAFVGAYNLTAPEPVRNKTFSASLGSEMKRPSFFPVPGFILRIVIGEFAATLLGGQKAIPKRLLDAGFEFKYPLLKEALHSFGL